MVALIPIPSGHRKLLDMALELIEQCRISVGMRGAYCRMMNSIAETGRYDGTKSLLNLLNRNLDREAAHLFSPVELKFQLDFENPYPKNILDRGSEIAKLLTRQWERSGTAGVFARGVFESLKYGAAILKQWVEEEGEGASMHPRYKKKLVMPWQFGVYREDENDIHEQEALCHTSILTMPEVWRRIWMLDGAEKLFSRIKTHARKGTADADPQSFFHQVLSTSQINTGVQGATRPLPGGIVQLNNDPNYAIMGPQLGIETVQFHELWVKDQIDNKDTYTTIQVIEPDVLMAPRSKRSNLLIKDSMVQPFRLIQPNEVTNWFWGRSSLVDAIEPQGLLSSWCDDLRRLFGMQVDKLLAFTGENSITDELYAQFRGAGYANLGMNGKVDDLTPKIPPETLPLIKFLIDSINELMGFPEIMQGKGEEGVRAGSHANTLMKTASPTLRDRSLIVEQQCASAADLTLTLMEAKDSKKYWTDGSDIKKIEETSFVLAADMPEDWRVSVDSHSSSPIFSDENQQLVFAAHKMGIVDGHYVIDNSNLPNKENAKTALRAKEAQQAKLMADLQKTDPEAFVKLLSHGGGKHH